MKRKSQWIEGFEFFELGLGYDAEVLNDIILFYDVEIPIIIIQYLKYFRPIEIWNEKMYEEGVNFVSSRYEVEDGILLNEKFNQFLPFYNLDEIRDRLLNWDSEISKIFKTKRLLPICQGVPNGDIVVSLRSDHTRGKLYYIIDHYELEPLEERIFCNSLFEFISALKEVPR